MLLLDRDRLVGTVSIMRLEAAVRNLCIESSPCPALCKFVFRVCCDLRERPVFLLRGSASTYALAALFSLRAHAARKSNSQVGLTIDLCCVSRQRPLIEETTMLLVPTRILHAFVSPTMFAQNSANTVFATQHYCRAHQQVYGSVCLGG